MEVDFSERLLNWYDELNQRQMPWKGEKDPYKVWISEIILQQTRVEQGESYYIRFINKYPDVASLAAAADEDVFKLWEGLGYYSRCRNILFTARYIVNSLDGKFPSTYEEILQLKGIGPYTAAAIASFAFGESKAVVDGNVQRVLARFFGISTPVDSKSGKELFSDLANSLIEARRPGVYNQAIMDFGATVCKPAKPLCSSCIQNVNCEAYNNNYVHILPVKEKQLKKRTRWLNYFIVRHGDLVFIRKRSTSDIWQDLHEFILYESDSELLDNPSGVLDKVFPGKSYHIIHKHSSRGQQLSHQHIRGNFYVVDLIEQPEPNTEYGLVTKSSLGRYAFPRFINSFLETYTL